MPASCDAEEQILARELEQQAVDPDCGVSVRRHDFCAWDIGVLEGKDLMLGFPAPNDEFCEFVDGGTDVLTCDFYKAEDIDKTLAKCVDNGGMNLNVTSLSFCDDAGDERNVGPWCIPDTCDPYEILAQKEEETRATLPNECAYTLSSVDLTSAPTLSPAPTATKTSSPTSTPTLNPTVAPTTATPTTSPTVTESASPSSTPTATPSIAPTMFPSTPLPTHPPTTTPHPCKDLGFLSPEKCATQNATYPGLGLTFPTALTEKHCNVTHADNSTIVVCDLYPTKDLRPLLKKCEANGGDSVPVTVREVCPLPSSQTNEEIYIAPLCVPKGCETEEYLLRFRDSATSSTKADCTKTVSFDSADNILPYCADPCIDRTASLDETQCQKKQWALQIESKFYNGLTAEYQFAYCSSTSDRGYPIIDCDLYRDPYVFDFIEMCGREGGDAVSVTQTKRCEPRQGGISVLITTAPMCVPKICDAYVFLPYIRGEFQRDDGGRDCEISLKYDVRKHVEYCDVEEPKGHNVTLGEVCSEKLEEMERNETGVGMDDGARKICGTQTIDGTIKTQCVYYETALADTMAKCNTTGGEYVVYNTTTRKECTVYGQDTASILPNLMCLPKSCDPQKVRKVLAYEKEYELGPECIVRSEDGFPSERTRSPSGIPSSTPSSAPSSTPSTITPKISSQTSSSPSVVPRALLNPPSSNSLSRKWIIVIIVMCLVVSIVLGLCLGLYWRKKHEHKGKLPMYSSAKKSEGTQSDASLPKKEPKASVLHKIEEDGEKDNVSEKVIFQDDDSPSGAKVDAFQDEKKEPETSNNVPNDDDHGNSVLHKPEDDVEKVNVSAKVTFQDDDSSFVAKIDAFQDEKKEPETSNNISKDGGGENPALHKPEDDGEKVNTSADLNSL